MAIIIKIAGLGLSEKELLLFALVVNQTGKLPGLSEIQLLLVALVDNTTGKFPGLGEIQLML